MLSIVHYERRVGTQGFLLGEFMICSANVAQKHSELTVPRRWCADATRCRTNLTVTPKLPSCKTGRRFSRNTDYFGFCRSSRPNERPMISFMISLLPAKILEMRALAY